MSYSASLFQICNIQSFIGGQIYFELKFYSEQSKLWVVKLSSCQTIYTHCLLNIGCTYLRAVHVKSPVHWLSSRAPSDDQLTYCRGRRASLDIDLAGLSREADMQQNGQEWGKWRMDDEEELERKMMFTMVSMHAQRSLSIFSISLKKYCCSIVIHYEWYMCQNKILYSCQLKRV